MPIIYECSRHRVGLVLEVIKLTPVSRALTNIQRVTFYRCPAVDNGKRCTYMKPNKWQKYPLKGKK